MNTFVEINFKKYNMNFKNKNVIVTGGSRGIGLAAAKAFVEAEANVWITGRNAESLKNAEAVINSPNLKTIVSDTSDLKSIAELAQKVSDGGKKIDVLFLNAGIASFAPIEHATEAEFDAQFNTNVKGVYFTLQHLIPHIANGGSVVFTSSTNATASSLGSSIYAATKAALNKIAQVAANELADRNIRVNIISPGPTQTPGLENAVPAEAKEYLASLTAVQRLGKPEEIAKAILFVASEQASFITGTEIIVDGGVTNFMLK